MIPWRADSASFCRTPRTRIAPRLTFSGLERVGHEDLSSSPPNIQPIPVGWSVEYTSSPPTAQGDRAGGHV